MRLNHTEVISADELEAIHDASLRILEQIGMEFLDPEARSVARAHGADVDEAEQRVRFPREVVASAIATVPREFTLHSWNPGRSLRIGYPVEPVDLHHGIRHLEAAFDTLTLTDKGLHCYSLGRQRNRDLLAMVRIARGIDAATLLREPSVITVVNTNSPLRLDVPMSQGMIEFAQHNQPVVVTPFTLAGAFTSNVDMQSGAPAFGTPEYVKTAMIGGQLCRRYGFPYRSSNVCAANALDAQAAYESVFALWGAIMGGVNFVMHGAGWMEGGLHASLGKMVLDADLLQMVSAMLDPLVVDESTMPLRTLLRHRPHPGAVPRRVLPAAAERLAELRDVERGRPADGRAQGQRPGRTLPGGIRTTGDGFSRQGRTPRLRRRAHRRRRRGHGLLSGGESSDGRVRGIRT